MGLGRDLVVLITTRGIPEHMAEIRLAMDQKHGLQRPLANAGMPHALLPQRNIRQLSCEYTKSNMPDRIFTRDRPLKRYGQNRNAALTLDG